MEYMRPESYAYPYPAGTYDRNAAYAYSNTYGRGSYDMQAAYGERVWPVDMYTHVRILSRPPLSHTNTSARAHTYTHPHTHTLIHTHTHTHSSTHHTHTHTGMYGASMGVSAYGQTPSSYGPSRTTGYGAGVGTAADYGKDRNTSRQSYHPYRRAQ